MKHTLTLSKKILYIIIGIILLLALWEVIALIIKEESLIFPGPIKSFKAFFQLFKEKYTYYCIGATLKRMVIGFSIALLISIIFGTLAGCFKRIELIFIPFNSMLKAIPTASILFLFLVIAGAKNAPIYVVILLSFPVLYDSIVGGIQSISKNIIDATNLESGSFLKKASKIYLPLSTKYILIGIASSFGLAYKVEIMAEILTGSTGKGIGIAIKTAQITDVNIVPIFAWTIMAVLILFIINLFCRAIKNIFLQ